MAIPIFSFFNIKKTENTKIDAGNAVISDSVSELDRDTDAEIYNGAGIISRPAKNTKAWRFQIGALSIAFAYRNYKIEPPKKEGETRIYSSDSDGELQSDFYLTDDGKFIFNNGKDFAVRFSKLEEGFNKLVSDFNNHMHLIPVYTAPVGSPAPTPPPQVTSTAEISGAKIEEIQVP